VKEQTFLLKQHLGWGGPARYLFLIDEIWYCVQQLLRFGKIAEGYVAAYDDDWEPDDGPRTSWTYRPLKSNTSRGSYNANRK
jgi:hypothetical protein